MNENFHVSFTPDEVAKKAVFYNFAKQAPDSSDQQGVSVFYKDPTDHVFHTYSTYARGIDMVNTGFRNRCYRRRLQKLRRLVRSQRDMSKNK